MQPVTLNAADVSLWVTRLWWPTLRVGGFVLSAPIASETTIPSFIKIIMSVSLAFLMSPLVRTPADLSIFSAMGLFAAVQEMLIGVAIGMVVQLAFEALTFAGQTVSLTMGLGFATLPIGALHVDGNFLATVASWGAHVFESGLLIALPAVIALLIVNLALGVVTRAAPQLNLFGIGFTITLMSGFFVLLAGLDGIMSSITSLIDSALQAASSLVGAPAVGVP